MGDSTIVTDKKVATRQQSGGLRQLQLPNKQGVLRKRKLVEDSYVVLSRTQNHYDSTAAFLPTLSNRFVPAERPIFFFSSAAGSHGQHLARVDTKKTMPVALSPSLCVRRYRHWGTALDRSSSRYA
jgi:hypothetical protein